MKAERAAIQIVQHPWFQRLVLVAILAAGILAGLETQKELMARHGGLLHALDTAILGIFVLEAALKIAALGRSYFKDGWNLFDFAIVLLCLLPLESEFAVVLRLVRLLRVLRLITALPKLQLLVGALLRSMSSMGYVTLLLALMFYIYAVAGVHLFGSGGNGPFGSLSTALLSLFQIITLDNWSDLFATVSVAAPMAATVYFISFILMGTMIMLNLFIGVITNSMAEIHAEIEAPSPAPTTGGLADDMRLSQTP